MSLPDDPLPLPVPLRSSRRPWLPSLVWCIPLLAALLGLGLLGYTLWQTGPELEVSFPSAEGLVPGKTAVRYRSVDIGVVKAVRLDEDLRKVIVTIALLQRSDKFLAADTRFWIVRPRLAVGSIAALETIISGPYIAVDVGRIGHGSSRHFIGEEAPPAVTHEEQGRVFQIRARDLGSLEIGSPVYFRRVQVGRVSAYRLDARTDEVVISVFIKSPHDRLVARNTRFWHASGINVNLDANGLKLNAESISSVLQGGIAFDTAGPRDPAGAPAADSVFALAADRAAAMSSQDPSQPLLAVMYFDQSLRGLNAGAPVDFRGIVVGQVRSVSVQYQRQSNSFRFPVLVELYPGRVGLSAGDLADRDHGQALARQMNRKGLRAQLRSGNLLTGQLYVALDFFPKARPTPLRLDDSLPEIATIPGSLEELQAQLASVMTNLNKIPFDRLGGQMSDALERLQKLLLTTEGLIGNVDQSLMPQLHKTLLQANQSLRDTSALLAPGAPFAQDSRRMVQELTQAASSLKQLSDYLARHPEALLKGRSAGEQP